MKNEEIRYNKFITGLMRVMVLLLVLVAVSGCCIRSHDPYRAKSSGVSRIDDTTACTYAVYECGCVTREYWKVDPDHFDEALAALSLHYRVYCLASYGVKIYNNGMQYVKKIEE